MHRSTSLGGPSNGGKDPVKNGRPTPTSFLRKPSSQLPQSLKPPAGTSGRNSTLRSSSLRPKTSDPNFAKVGNQDNEKPLKQRTPIRPNYATPIGSGHESSSGSLKPLRPTPRSLSLAGTVTSDRRPVSGRRSITGAVTRSITNGINRPDHRVNDELKKSKSPTTGSANAKAVSGKNLSSRDPNSRISEPRNEISEQKINNENSAKENAPVDASNEEREKLQRIILKLQEKIRSMSQEIESFKQTISILETENSKLKETAEVNEENFEMLTIDKEVLDEQNQSLTDGLERLNEKYSQLKKELDLLKIQGGIATKMEKKEEEVGADVLVERNEKLEIALIKLREVSNSKEFELTSQIELLTNQLESSEDYKQKYETVSRELERAQLLIVDLKYQLDSLLESADLIESLTEKNDNLTEANTRLKQTVEELEDLRDLANDLEDAHIQTEKELKNDIKQLQKVIDGEKITIENLEKQTKYYETLISTQRQKHENELIKTRTEFSDILQSNTMESIHGGADVEILENKINELNLKISRLNSINSQNELQNKILHLDYTNEHNLLEFYEKSFETVVGENDPKIKNYEDLVKCIQLIPSITEVLDIITNMIFSNDSNSTCEMLYGGKDFMQLESFYQILLTKLKYVEDTEDYSKILNSLSTTYKYLKDTSSKISNSELSVGKFSDAISYVTNTLALAFPDSKGNDFESFYREIFDGWSNFEFKSVDRLSLQLLNILSHAKVCVKYLGLINRFIENDVTIALETDSKDGIANVTRGFSDLLKNYLTLQILCENQLSDLSFKKSKNQELVGDIEEIFSGSIFFKSIGHLTEITSDLFKIALKIEYENNSFTAELEGKDFNSILSKFLNDPSLLKNQRSKIQSVIECLSNFPKFATKTIDQKPFYERYFEQHLLSNDSSRNVKEVETLNSQISELANSFNEKDQLISQLTLKINVLKNKLGIEADKDSKIKALEQSMDQAVKDLSKQKKTIESLSVTNRRQALELRRKLKNKNLIGDFTSIFEEKEFVGKLTLMSEIQVMKDVVGYLTVQLREQKSKLTSSIFGLPTSFDWLTTNKSSASSDLLSNHSKLRQVTQRKLFDLASRTKVLSVKQPNDKELLSWRPKASLQSYYVATIDKQFCEYRNDKARVLH
ncbi:hypothetical protein DASC09_062040 [Saccharomycopsis crataegensis]|uniref:Uncharacterized protein n=1 Tax=Saccharomycopsis crataegensis TaxID=43959 RepID=A0AAV5QW67_9ASCO|nr:hypothetical protein DASC09_062040 [Saccharomycopsis crataegensis]